MPESVVVVVSQDINARRDNIKMIIPVTTNSRITIDTVPLESHRSK